MSEKDKIKAKIKVLEEQKEKMKYDGNVCFADYEQFCKNLKFFKEQIEELLEESTNEWFKRNGDGLYKISQRCVWSKRTKSNERKIRWQKNN